MGKAVGLETERQRVSAYLHERLAPELLAIAFSLEAVREQLEQEKHSAEAKLKEVCRNLTELLHPVHEELLNPGLLPAAAKQSTSVKMTEATRRDQLTVFIELVCHLAWPSCMGKYSEHLRSYQQVVHAIG